MMRLAVVAHAKKELGGGLPELRRVLESEGIESPLWYEVPKAKKARAQVERALSNCPGVRDGAVVVRRDAAGVARAIVAFAELQPGTRGLLPRHLRAMLEKRLPQHMVPAIVSVVDALPRLPSFKIDRVQLAKIDADAAGRSPEHEQAELIRQVALTFESILEIEGATADDNVFSLGGDSLQALDIGLALEQLVGVRVPAEFLDAAPTIREIAERIAGEMNRLRSAEVSL